MARILAFAGSARRASYNKRLLRAAVAGAREAGAEVTVLDLADYPLPVFDQDLEDAGGVPENARKLKAAFLAHDGLLIASPEYNSSIPPLLKNTIDWVSRKTAPDEASLSAYTGKTAVILATSPGALGGLRALRHLREILTNIGVLVLPRQRAVPKAHEVFDEDGEIRDERLGEAIAALGRELAETVRRLRTGGADV